MSEGALRYLFEAAQTGSMRAASDKLGVAVSSISRQIAQLEGEYGVPLIERGRRSIQLTEAGRLAVDYYRSRVADRDAFLSRLKDLQGVRTGNVRLAVGEGFLSAGFMSLIDDFRSRNPMIQVEVMSAPTADIVNWILNDEAHLGLILQVPVEPKIRLRTSIAQPLMAMMSPTHPLAQSARVTLAELAAQALCLPPKSFRIRQLLATAEARQHVFLEPRITTNSIFVMREAARAGGVVTVLPQIAAWAEIQEGSLIARPLAGETIEEATVALISRAGRQLSGAPIRFLSAVEARLRNWTAPPEACPTQGTH